MQSTVIFLRSILPRNYTRKIVIWPGRRTLINSSAITRSINWLILGNRAKIETRMPLLVGISSSKICRWVRVSLSFKLVSSQGSTKYLLKGETALQYVMSSNRRCQCTNRSCGKKGRDWSELQNLEKISKDPQCIKNQIVYQGCSISTSHRKSWPTPIIYLVLSFKHQEPF